VEVKIDPKKRDEGKTALVVDDSVVFISRVCPTPISGADIPDLADS